MAQEKRSFLRRVSIFRALAFGLRRRRAREGAPATPFANERAPVELFDAVGKARARATAQNLVRALVIAGFVLGSVSMALSTVGLTRCSKDGECTTTVWYPLSIVKKREVVRTRGGTLHGRYTEWFWHGQIAFDGTYDAGQKDGEWREWWPNGNLRYSGLYDAGRRQGLEQWWYESGHQEWVGTFKDGRRHGLETWWHDGGPVRMTGHWVDGYADGTFEMYGEDGERVASREMGLVVE